LFVAGGFGLPFAHASTFQLRFTVIAARSRLDPG